MLGMIQMLINIYGMLNPKYVKQLNVVLPTNFLITF